MFTNKQTEAVSAAVAAGRSAFVVGSEKTDVLRALAESLGTQGLNVAHAGDLIADDLYRAKGRDNATRRIVAAADILIVEAGSLLDLAEERCTPGGRADLLVLGAALRRIRGHKSRQRREQPFGGLQIVAAHPNDADLGDLARTPGFGADSIFTL